MTKMEREYDQIPREPTEFERDLATARSLFPTLRKEPYVKNCPLGLFGRKHKWHDIKGTMLAVCVKCGKTLWWWGDDSPESSYGEKLIGYIDPNKETLPPGKGLHRKEDLK